LRLCGFAAPRAESLRLSVERRISFGGYAARGEASPFLKTAIGKPEAFRTGGGKAASKNTKPQGHEAARSRSGKVTSRKNTKPQGHEAARMLR